MRLAAPLLTMLCLASCVPVAHGQTAPASRQAPAPSAPAPAPEPREPATSPPPRQAAAKPGPQSAPSAELTPPPAGSQTSGGSDGATAPANPPAALAAPDPQPSAVTSEGGLVVQAPPRDPKKVIIVGVRADAQPFSYKLNGPRRSDSRFPRPESAYYDGYVVRICGHVIAEVERPPLNLAFAPKEVSADERAAFLRGESAGIDILCDPATITDERLERLIASAPIYLSGITFASLPEIPERVPCGQLVGMVGGTTADEYGLEAILKAGEIPNAAPTLRAAMSDPEGAKPSEDCIERGREAGQPEEYQKPPILLADNHDDIAREFCAGRLVYYIGDIEIVRAHLDAIPDCKFRGAAVTYREERYAIFGRLPPPDETVKVRNVLEFFRELSRQSYNKDSVLIDSYNSTFPDSTPSIKLKALYWSLTGEYPRRN